MVSQSKKKKSIEELVKTIILPESDIEGPIIEMPLPKSKDIESEDKPVDFK